MDSSKIIKDWAKDGKTYFIQTFGCQLNENDSEKLAGQLDAFGLKPVSDPQLADLYSHQYLCHSGKCKRSFLWSSGLFQDVERSQARDSDWGLWLPHDERCLC